MKSKIMKMIFASVVLLLFFTSNAEASLSIHPGSINDSISAGNNTSVLHITNVGPTSVLDYQLSADVSWINFNSISGSINKGDTVSIIITYNISELQNGTNNSNIFAGDPHHGPITIPVEVYLQGTTGVQEDYFFNSPVSFSLEQNYPNPFNPTTKISFSIPETQKVSLKIYNLLGNELFTVVDEVKGKGEYSIDIDMSRFASGIYFYKIKAGKYVQTKKMILNK